MFATYVEKLWTLIIEGQLLNISRNTKMLTKFQKPKE